LNDPVAVGGIGGSGTRVVAALLGSLGYYLGDDLNESLDNLWFTLFFRRRSILLEDEQSLNELIRLFASRMSGDVSASPETRAIVSSLPMRHGGEFRQVLMKRADTFLGAGTGRREDQPWGWKEPNTHVIIDRLLAQCPALRYLHVIRHPLDMAFSANQYQLFLWGPVFLERDVTITPRDSLSYWCAAHRRIARLAARWPERIRFVDFDALCAMPERHYLELAESLGFAPSAGAVARICNGVRPPASTGRFSRHDLGQFDPVDLSYVRQIGYAC
jgi:Sulfotransferase family